MRVPIASLPRELTALDAVQAAYADELGELAACARRGEAALVECDEVLAALVHRALRDRMADPTTGRPLRARYVAGHEPERVALGARVELQVRPTSLAAALLAELRRALQAGAEDELLVVGRFELLATSAGPDGAPTLAAREAAALLLDHPGVPLLCLHAPDVLVPEPLARAFRRRGAVGPVSPDRLRHLVRRREARKLDVEHFDPALLAPHVDGLDALALRQALERLADRVDFDPRCLAERDALLAELAAAPRRHVEPRPLVAGPGSSEVEWRLRGRP